MQCGDGEGSTVSKPHGAAYGEQPPLNSSSCSVSPPAGPLSGSAFFRGPGVGTGWGLGSLFPHSAEPTRPLCSEAPVHLGGARPAVF